MTAAPDHRPTMARAGLVDRLAPWLPLILVPALVVAGWLAIPSTSSWLTLTVSGLAMGMMIFLMAAGLTLVFGLMDVINFGHGAFVSVGAFVGVSVLIALGTWTAAASLPLNLAAFGLAALTWTSRRSSSAASLNAPWARRLCLSRPNTSSSHVASNPAFQISWSGKAPPPWGKLARERRCRA
jgi:hypothetical protein